MSQNDNSGPVKSKSEQLSEQKLDGYFYRFMEFEANL